MLPMAPVFWKWHAVFQGREQEGQSLACLKTNPMQHTPPHRHTHTHTHARAHERAYIKNIQAQEQKQDCRIVSSLARVTLDEPEAQAALVGPGNIANLNDASGLLFGCVRHGTAHHTLRAVPIPSTHALLDATLTRDVCVCKVEAPVPVTHDVCVCAR